MWKYVSDQKKAQNVRDDDPFPLDITLAHMMSVYSCAQPPGTPSTVHYAYKYGVDGNMTPPFVNGEALKAFIVQQRSLAAPTLLRTPLESFSITCTPSTPLAKDEFGNPELDPTTLRILNYELLGSQPADIKPLRDLIGIWELDNKLNWVKKEDLMDISVKSITTDDMIKRVVAGYSWNGAGPPFVLRIVMQHCGVIWSTDKEYTEYYTNNSDRVLQYIPHVATYNGSDSLYDMLVEHFTKFLPPPPPPPPHPGGSRRITRKRTSSKRARKSRRNAVHSRRRSIYRRSSRSSRISAR
jgi:hypothetical protein